jgi:histone H3/H4
LASSISENGLRVALQVLEKDGKYYVHAGFRRMRAVRHLVEQGIWNSDTMVNAVLVPYKEEQEEERLFGFFTTNSGKPLDALEQANLFSRLKKMGIKQKMIAKRLGLKDSYVSQTLSLITNEVVHNLLKEDKIKPSIAAKLIQESKGDVDTIRDTIGVAQNIAEIEGRTTITSTDINTAREEMDTASEDTDTSAGKKRIKTLPDVLKPSGAIVILQDIVFDTMGQTNMSVFNDILMDLTEVFKKNLSQKDFVSKYTEVFSANAENLNYQLTSSDDDDSDDNDTDSFED